MSGAGFEVKQHSERHEEHQHKIDCAQGLVMAIVQVVVEITRRRNSGSAVLGNIGQCLPGSDSGQFLGLDICITVVSLQFLIEGRHSHGENLKNVCTNSNVSLDLYERYAGALYCKMAACCVDVLVSSLF